MRQRVISVAKRSRLLQLVGRAADAAIPCPESICTVLTFHRIDTGAPDLYPGLAGLDAHSFERFVDELLRRFSAVSIDELVAALDADTRLPERSVLFTFDDAYRDFADAAWPILKERGVPTVLFVPTAYPGDPARRFWWDELYAAFAGSTPSDWRAIGIDAVDAAAAFRSVRDRIKALPHDDAERVVAEMVGGLGGAVAATQHERGRVLDWDELGQLASEGLALAPHSRTHPMLDRLPVERLDDEIRGSFDDLRHRIGRERVAPVFAYPAGGHDPRVREAVRRAGFAAAFTTERGLIDVRGSDPHRLPRLNVGRGASASIVAAEAAARRLGHLRGGHRRGARENGRG